MNAAASNRQVGLGRGLGELFQRTEGASPQQTGGPGSGAAAGPPADPNGPRFDEIRIELITPNPKQPRQVFDEEALTELAGSIREVGLLQPVVVRPLAGGRYELVMGERRLRASKLAGRETIPALVRRTEDEVLLRDALLENLHRAQLNPLEEAAAYQQMLDDFGCTQEELSVRIKRSRPQISNTIRLLKLPPVVQRRVAAGVLSAGHARALLSLDSPTAMEKLAQRVVAEGLSVRATEELATLAEPSRQERVARKPKVASAIAAKAASQLENLLDTRVKIDLGQRKGKITIEFAGDEDLYRILDKILDKRGG